MEESMSTREEGTSMEALNTIPFLTKPYTRRITKDSTRAKILRDETGTKGFISFKKTNIIQIKVHETCKSSFMD